MTPDELLARIPRLKVEVVPGDQPALSCFRRSDLTEHLNWVRAEFRGSPELCFFHASLIIHVRREIELSRNLECFFLLWKTESPFLLRHLSSRWLISACDTFADHGLPLERAHAALISAVFNMLRLSETERVIMTDPTHSDTRLDDVDQRLAHGTFELWDRMTVYAMRAGDAPRNMFTRIRTVLAVNPFLSSMFDTLLERALSGDTALSRLAA